MTSEEKKDAKGLVKAYKMKINAVGEGRPANIYHAAQCIGTWSAIKCAQRMKPPQILHMLRTSNLPFIKTVVCQYIRNAQDEWEAISYSYTNEFSMMAASITARAGIPMRE